MSRKGNCLDAVMEDFFGLLKLEFRSVIIMNNIEFLEMIRWNLD